MMAMLYVLQFYTFLIKHPGSFSSTAIFLYGKASLYTALVFIKKMHIFPLALQPHIWPWATSMKLSVSLQFTRS
jgi:hypothetical protein